MANRVLLNSSGLKISKPGFNVLSTADRNLIFNSDWSAFSLVTSGTHTVTFGSGLTGSASQNISYGVSTSGRQIVLFEMVSGSQYRALGGGGSFWYGLTADMYEGTTYRNTAWWTVEATSNTSNITVSRAWDRGGRSNIILPDFSFRWTLFSYNY